MFNPQLKPGDTVLLPVTVDRPVKTEGDTYREQPMFNHRGNLWWAKLCDTELVLCQDGAMTKIAENVYVGGAQ